MRRPVLAAGAAAFALLPVLAAGGQNAGHQARAAGNPHGDLKLECSECHTAERWTPLDETPAFRHETTGFRLESAHARVSCKACHRTLVFDRVGSACADCHEDSHKGELGFQCESCHTPTSWTNQQEMFRVHDRTRFPLFASHARLDCSACHRRQQAHEYESTPAECGNCHLSTYLATTNPSHVQAGFSRRCEDCHQITATSWRTAVFTHPASFPLQGAHAGLTCARCHARGTYTGLSTACDSCHQADYAATTNPNHAAGRFPLECESCHTTTSWRPAKFDHAQTGFALTGAHTRTACDRCHPGGRYAGTPTDCYSCHQSDYAGTTNPNHQASGFATTCQSCHDTTAWRPANFDHGKTRFPLTGAHARVDCAQCHPGGRYAGTPTDCYSCHQADYAGTTNPNHQAAGFPVQCQSCHTTSAWKPATFDHDGPYFPIYSGKHRGKWTSCGDCHVSSGNYKAFECILCHEHSNRAAVDDKHKGVTGYAYSSAACYRCHPRGVAGDSLGYPRRRLP